MKTKLEINFDHFAIATVDLDDTVKNLEKKLKYPFSNGGDTRYLVRTIAYLG